MDYLELVRRVRRETAFTCLANYIKREEEIPQQCKVHLGEVQNILGEAIRGLESMTSGLGYYFVENLREIVETMGFGSESYPKKKIKDITAEFKDILKDMMRLEESPREIYQDEEKKKRLVNVCENMTVFYSRKIPNPRVLGERVIPKFDRF